MLPKITFLLCLSMIVFSCSKEQEFIKNEAENGPYVKFLNADNFPKGEHTGFVSSWSFSGEVEAPSNNVKTYELFIGIGSEEPLKSSIILSTFPTTLSISGNDILNTLSKSDSDFTEDTDLRFYGLVTGNDGLVAKDFPGNSNVSTDFINWNVGTFSAYQFRVTFKQ